MKRCVVWFAVTLMSLGCGGSEPAPTPPTSTASPTATIPVASSAPSTTSPAIDAGAVTNMKPTDPTSTPLNELSLATLRALRSEKGNVFFSGASIRDALGMTALGARGKTLDEMTKALALDSDPTKNAAAAKAEREVWSKSAGKATLKIADRVWIQTSYTVERAFTQAAESGYGAPPASLDFGAPEPARMAINSWVSNATTGRIKDLLPLGSITPLTRLVITDAVYFKAAWVERFDVARTKDEPFHIEGGTKSVPTMHRTGSMSYAENEEVQLVSLPYKDSDLALLVALPKPSARLDEMLTEVSGGEVAAWTKSLTSARVDLSLPKFTYSWGRSIKGELQALGIVTAFGEDADFSGIAKAKTPQDKLYVSDVFHKAFVLVDEVGTEAAAATGVVMAVRGMPAPSVVMKVDRPFLFFVQNTKTGDVLFAGRVVDPKP